MLHHPYLHLPLFALDFLFKLDGLWGRRLDKKVGLVVGLRVDKEGRACCTITRGSQMGDRL